MTPTTRSQAITRSLAEDIISGKLAPGCKLDEQWLAERFRVSRTPVRDALRELATTRLIEYLPRRGFSVARIDPTKLDDMFEAATEIEALCARLCALRAGSTDRTRIKHIHDQSEAAVRKARVKDYASLNEEFHAAIYAGTRNQTIASLALDLRQRLAPFRSRVFFSPDRMRTSVAEHKDIVAAILDHDGDRAATAMRNHTARSAMNALQHFAKLTAAEQQRVQPRRQASAR